MTAHPILHLDRSHFALRTVLWQAQIGVPASTRRSRLSPTYAGERYPALATCTTSSPTRILAGERWQSPHLPKKAKNEGHRRIFSGDVEFRVQGMRGNPLGQQCYSDVTPVRNCTIRAFDAGFSPNSGVWGLKR
jgi:hypothetical protein